MFLLSVLSPESFSLFPRFSRRLGVSAFILFLVLAQSGCYILQVSDGGGQNVVFTGPRRVNPADIAVPDGYGVSVVAQGLDLPTGLACDDGGNVFVTESGDDGTAPRLLRVGATTDVIATGAGGAWTGLSARRGAFFVAQDDPDGGRIMQISADGKQTPLAENLPTLGDYPAGAPLPAPDGYLYFAVGAATNSGIVGPDNDSGGSPFRPRGWLTQNRRFHDIPGADVQLSGLNVRTEDPFTAGETKVTGAFSPFGEPTAAGQTVSGQVPCTAAVMRVPLSSGPPELVAWGLRDAAGLAFSPDGRLFATDQEYENRGARPVAGCGDLLCVVRAGTWYGFPDDWGPRPLEGPRRFAAAGKPPPQILLAAHPAAPPRPAAILPLHGLAVGLDFCRSGDFGHAGEAFIAEFGDTAPVCGKVLYPVGFEVLRVDVATGVSHVFAANRCEINGPASKIGSGGLERPIAVRFSPSGDTLYVLDYGVVTVGDGIHPQPHTGVLWKITREERQK